MRKVFHCCGDSEYNSMYQKEKDIWRINEADTSDVKWRGSTYPQCGIGLRVERGQRRHAADKHTLVVQTESEKWKRKTGTCTCTHTLYKWKQKKAQTILRKWRRRRLKKMKKKSSILKIANHTEGKNKAQLNSHSMAHISYTIYSHLNIICNLLSSAYYIQYISYVISSYTIGCAS